MKQICKIIINQQTKSIQLSIMRGKRNSAANPGISKQLKLLTNKQTHSLDPTDFHDSESDFMNVHQSHKLHEKEEVYQKNLMEYRIVKNKYFKSKNYNFLTWSEKEQIRYLYNQDPNEWNCEKLSESFPADISIISKIVKSKWFPIDRKRIDKHDLAVKENWKRFKNNEIKELDETLKIHLSKFVIRKYETTKISEFENKKIVNIPEPIQSEFSSIILGTRNKIKTEFDDESIPKLQQKLTKNEMFLMGHIRDTNYIQFQHISEMEKKAENSDEFIESSSQSNVLNVNTDKRINVLKTKKEFLDISKSNPSNILSNEIIQETITIPKKYFKKGATYRVDDCYYDDDGEFLYRVPGMTK